MDGSDKRDIQQLTLTFVQIIYPISMRGADSPMILDSFQHPTGGVLWVLAKNTEPGALSSDSTPNTHAVLLHLIICKCELENSLLLNFLKNGFELFVCGFH